MIPAGLEYEVFKFVGRGFKHIRNISMPSFPSNQLWKRILECGTALWLDTGSMSETAGNWTREFTALTTNNTLLNKEIQTGQYDSLIAESAEILSGWSDVTDHEKLLEIDFILNARHALSLVERFGAFVSVEEHTAYAGEVDAAVNCARRYHEICPERFIIKIPFTPAGLLAARRLSFEKVPVNMTLGFSARQNYIAARIGRPSFVNVFLGRLNAFVHDNGIGDGYLVGEKATIASQSAVRCLKDSHKLTVKQIGASLRSGLQVCDLVGIDVMTLPPKVAGEFLTLGVVPERIVDRSRSDYNPSVYHSADSLSAGLETLWDIDDRLISCLDALEKEALDAFGPNDLIRFFADYGCKDIFVRWSAKQEATSLEEGKIPKLDTWQGLLASGTIGLDSLMNFAGLNSFAADQKAMDDRMSEVVLGHSVRT